jgi:hypothetical protein
MEKWQIITSLLCLILEFVCIYKFAQEDKEDIEDGIKINHSRKAIIVSMLCLIFTLITHRFELFVCYLLVWWWLFDITLNYMRGLPLFYVGKISILDQLLKLFPFHVFINKLIYSILILIINYKLLK